MSAASSTLWLEEYQQWLEEGRDPHEAAERLRRYLDDREESEREQLLGRAYEILLQDCRAYGVALQLTDAIRDPEYVEEIARTIAPLPRLQSDDEEAHLADLMRILAASGRRHSLRVVESYLLDRPWSHAWTTVPWALWPRRTVLFRQAWVRWILERGNDAWSDRQTVEPFLTEPLAVHEIRAALTTCGTAEAARARDRFTVELRDAARRTRWLGEDQRAALAAALE